MSPSASDDLRGGGDPPPAPDFPSPAPGTLVLRLEVEVEAPPERVWRLLTRVEEWARWHPGISFAVLRGDLEPGTALHWRGDGMRIRSVVTEVEEGRRLGWTLRTLGARGLHRWSLEPVGETSTRVRSEEAWRGLPVRLLGGTLRRTLTASRTAWLERLRDRAESAPGP